MRILQMYLDPTGITDDNKDRPLSRPTPGSTKRLTTKPRTTIGQGVAGD